MTIKHLQIRVSSRIRNSVIEGTRKIPVKAMCL